MLSGAKSYQAIAQFGRDKGFALAHALGFTRGKTPTKSTFSVLFRLLDVQAFENGLSRWVGSRLPEHAQEMLICLDGKTVRGSRDGEVPGQHFVAAYASAAQAVLAQVRVDAKTNEHKAALELLGLLAGEGQNHQRRREVLPTRGLREDYRGRGRLSVRGQGQSTVVGGRHRAGLAYQEQARRLTAAFSP